MLNECIIGTYTINCDGSIDVNGSIALNDKKLEKIPFKFRNVYGIFYCCNNKLTSLNGVPNTVGNSFYCNNNQLTSLDGIPNNVGGDFCCHDNPNLPYSELFKIVDRVRGDIYYSCFNIPEDKDKIRRDRDVSPILKDDELGDLDV